MGLNRALTAARKASREATEVSAKSQKASTNGVTELAKTASKNAIITAGVTTGVLGTANILKDTKLFQGTSAATTTQTVDPEELIGDEDKRNIVEEIINRLQGGNSGGTTVTVGNTDPGETSASTFSEALSTIKQYLPWILGAGVVIFIASMSHNPQTAKAEAVKA